MGGRRQSRFGPRQSPDRFNAHSKLACSGSFEHQIRHAKLAGTSCALSKALTVTSVPNDTDSRSALIHREMIQLVLLIVVAVAAFVVTRAVAASNRDMSVRDAAEWFERGQRDLAAGHLDEAVEALRRATVRNRSDRR